MAQTKPIIISGPTDLPQDDSQRASFQEANRSWWEANPMRYDWRDHIEPEKFSKEYFEEIDSRFLAVACEFLPSRPQPFHALMGLDDLGDADVLEIGCGSGTHAQILAGAARSYTGIDLTEFAVESTKRRFGLNGLSGNIVQMDAERMQFADASFDFIWSWGVIHHSSDTARVLQEMRRVLRPGGRAVVMIYHRGWWNYYFVGAVLRGVLQRKFLRFRTVSDIIQDATDGAIARYYTPAEWREFASRWFDVEAVDVCGPKEDVLALPPGRVKALLKARMPESWCRFLTNSCQAGGFVVAHMQKPSDV
jgi:SAM-dependent methyltransferase